jgi:cytochrome c553
MRKRVILPIVGMSIFFLSMCGQRRSPVTNGEILYSTGKDSTGSVLASDIDRESLTNKQAVISCADCHGADRQGKSDGVPELSPFSAPALTAASLRASTVRRPGYDAASLATALTTGKTPAGKRLHYPMPRFDMAGRNLDDLVAFLLGS